MSYPIDVLHALLRLSRRRKSPTLDMLVAATGIHERGVRRSVFTLAQSGLVQRTPAGLHLTLAGLAVAVSLPKRPKVTPRPVARTVALVSQPSSRSRPRRAA
jgi:DNA-binding IclR family transcriptional regulator